MSDPWSLRVLRWLPKNLVSRGFGWLAARERPRFLVRPFMRWFVRRFELDLAEAQHPIERYPSLLALFTRQLKEGLRPIDARPGILVSPVDARVGSFGRIENGQLFQAKGMGYLLEALLGTRDFVEAFRGGAYMTLYLSPRDYHRMHVPDDGAITSTHYEPGTLWPVNAPAVRALPQLFALNERITTMIATARAPIGFVMVGATNVGRIRLSYADLTSNAGGPRRSIHHEPPIPVRRGDHLATFELGSTVVLLVGSTRFAWTDVEEGDWVAYGKAIGRYEA